MKALRDWELAVAMSYHGLWYSWGGDDPSGFDCSGLVIECLKSVGCLPRHGDWTAAGLSKTFQQVNGPLPGDLVFWQNGNGKIIHVEIVVDSEHKLSIGASGGGSRTKTRQDAIRHNAFIKIRPYKSRARLWGFVNPYDKK